MLVLTRKEHRVAIQRIDPTDPSLAALLEKAREEPLILQGEEGEEFAVMPVDDEVLDLLLERSPKFREECAQIRERMDQGVYLTHEQVLEALRESDASGS
jgi:hypothetical protein